MLKVRIEHLEAVTKLLDKISKTTDHPANKKKIWDNAEKAAKLSQTIKSEYTKIKPWYEEV